MASVCLTDTEACVNFFQQRILRAVAYWQNHDAVNSLEIAYLDRERDAILKAIALGLQFAPAWPLVRALIIAMTSYMERRGHWDAWHQVLLRAIAVSRRQGDTDHEVTLTALLARLCQRQSRPDDVVRYYRRVIRLARHSNNQFELARACSNLGFLYIDRGYWWRSEVLSLHALAIFEELQSDHGLAHTHNHLGLLYTKQQRWDVAQQNLVAACSLWQANEDIHSLVYGLENLGLLYYDMKRPTDAIDYLEQALNFITITGEEAERANVLNILGIVHIQEGNLYKAEELLNQAEDIFRKYSNSLGLAHVWLNLGVIATRRHEQRDAKFRLNGSLSMYKTLQNHDGIARVMLALIEYEIAREDRKQAVSRINDLENYIVQYIVESNRPYFRNHLNEFHHSLENTYD